MQISFFGVLLGVVLLIDFSRSPVCLTSLRSMTLKACRSQFERLSQKRKRYVFCWLETTWSGFKRSPSDATDLDPEVCDPVCSSNCRLVSKDAGPEGCSSGAEGGGGGVRGGVFQNNHFTLNQANKARKELWETDRSASRASQTKVNIEWLTKCWLQSLCSQPDPLWQGAFKIKPTVLV